MIIVICQRATLHQVHLEEAKFLSTTLSNVYFATLNNTEKKIPPTNMKMVEFKKVTLDGCGFQNANLDKSVFKDMNSKGNNHFKNAKLTNIDITTELQNEEFAETIQKEWTLRTALTNQFNMEAVGIIGGKGTGKSTLIHFLMFGSHKSHYKPTLGSLPVGKAEIIHSRKIAFNILNDISGDNDTAQKDWDKTIKNADRLIYMLDIAKYLASNNESGSYRTKVQNHIEHLHETLKRNDKQVAKKKVIIIATHADKCDGYSNLNHKEFKEHLLTLADIRLLLFVFGGTLVLGGLHTSEACKATMEEFKHALDKSNENYQKAKKLKT